MPHKAVHITAGQTEVPGDSDHSTNEASSQVT